jgi:hypothetical protein
MIPEYKKVGVDTCDNLAAGDWGGAVVLDPSNKTQGGASFSMAFYYEPHFNGWSMVCEKKYEPINVKNAVYIEMDVYLSDAERMKNAYGGYNGSGIHFEITSSGTCDWNEYGWVLNNYVFKNGWTHIRLPISEAVTPGADRGAPDMSAINYIRFHILGVKGDGQPTNFAVDNIYFSTPAQTGTLGATPIIREDDTPDTPDTPNTPDAPTGPDLPGGDQAGDSTQNDGSADSALRARKTEQRAKILLLLMVFVIIGIDVVVVALRRRNEQDAVLVTDGSDGQPPCGES